MKSLSMFFLSVLVSCLAISQEKELTLQQVWASGEFLPNTFPGVQSMNDGTHYTRSRSVQSPANNAIVKYHYEKEKPVDTLFSFRWLDTPYVNMHFSSYRFSEQENLILLKTSVSKIYRHSTRAVFYVYDRDVKDIMPVFDGKQVMYATLSPDEKHVAFVYQNNLYLQDNSGKVKQITRDGEKNKILNGRSDWVYEEEFKLVKAFRWSPDGEKLAYYKFDESRVKQYSLPEYVSGQSYPEMYTYKYPVAGEANSVISLHNYDLGSGKTVKLETGKEKDIYIPRIQWTSDPGILSYQKLNRWQNHLKLYFVEAKTGERTLVYEEKSQSYIDIDDDLTFLKDNRFIWSSGKSGYNHLYLLNDRGKELVQLTSGEWEVTDFLGVDEKQEQVYYRSAEVSPLQRHVYRVDLQGKDHERLTHREGTNQLSFSDDYSYYIHTHTSANRPHEVSVHKAGGKQVRVVVENSTLEQKMKDYNFTRKEFITFKTVDGTSLNGSMIKPTDFDADKKYPVLMYVYGGPGSQLVRDRWGWIYYVYFQYLAQKGYLIVTVDNRGTGARGEAFKKITYLNLGKYESIDQIAAAKYLAQKDYVDPKRIGIFGWSYGGYLSALCLMKGNEVFKSVVSVAPVTDWHFYDNIYTERFMRRPEDNPEGYKESAVMNYVDSLQGNLLLVHGTFDDNVHPINSMSLIREMVKRNKPFDSEFYPNKTHGIGGGYTRLHLFERITRFIFDHL